MFVNSRTRFASLTDGTSQTLAIGECLFSAKVYGVDGSGAGQIIDHWYIGTADTIAFKSSFIGEASESMGSTGVAMNNFEDSTIQVDEKELCFASHHWAERSSSSVTVTYRSCPRRSIAPRTAGWERALVPK